MSVKQTLITIGFDKNGEAEFGISGEICALDYKRMQELRAMIPVAIAQGEQMWMRAWMERPENRAVQAER